MSSVCKINISNNVMPALSGFNNINMIMFDVSVGYEATFLALLITNKDLQARAIQCESAS